MEYTRTFDLPLEKTKKAVLEVFDILGERVTNTGNIVRCKKENRTYIARFQEVGGKTDVSISVEIDRGFLGAFRKKIL
jgi:hypothetical protein